MRGTVTQNGLTSFVRDMWNCSPGMVQTWPSKTFGNSTMSSSAVGVEGG